MGENLDTLKQGYEEFNTGDIEADLRVAARTSARTRDEFFDHGDSIVVLRHNPVKKGDQAAELPVAHLWRVEDGKATALQPLTDTHRAAQVLGRS